MLVMQNYFTPQLLVSPVEVSKSVRVKDDYDWSRYDPAAGVLWDDSFAPVAQMRSSGKWKYTHEQTLRLVGVT